MTRTCILVLILLGTLSCKEVAADKKPISDSIESVVADKDPVAKHQKREEATKPIEMAEDCDQTFDDFFKRFARDSVFQKNRVKYPLKESYFESLAPTRIKVDSLSYKDYIYIDFTKDKDAMNNEYGKYNIEIEKISGSTIYYKNVGYDNGILVTYKFSLIEGCWYLVEILDEST